MRVRAAPRVVPLLIGLLRGALFLALLSVFMSGCYQRMTTGASLNSFAINVMSSCYNLLQFNCLHGMVMSLQWRLLLMY
jgi:hypothetical protein